MPAGANGAALGLFAMITFVGRTRTSPSGPGTRVHAQIFDGKLSDGFRRSSGRVGTPCFRIPGRGRTRQATGREAPRYNARAAHLARDSQCHVNPFTNRLAVDSVDVGMIR